jgi:hypothetical protein
MLPNLTPGQTIRCTVAKAPRAEAKIDTIERLMRLEPGVQRGLRRAQQRRRQDMVVYNRGNRDWYKREKCARLVKCTQGASWTMRYSHHLAPELRSIEGFVQVQPA